MNEMDIKPKELKAIILAGMGKKKGDKSDIGGKNTCFIKVPEDGVPVVQYVLNSLYEMGTEEIILKVDRNSDRDLQRLDLDSRVEVWTPKGDSTTLLEDAKALKDDHMQDKKPVLIIFGDHPFVSPKSASHFIANASEDANITVSFAPRFLLDYMGYQKRAPVCIREGRYYHAPYVLIRPENIDFSIFETWRGKRRQRYLMNFASSIYSLWKRTGTSAMLYYLAAYASTKLYDAGFVTASDKARKFASFDKGRSCIQRIIDPLRMDFMAIPYAETVIDLDFDRDLDQLRSRDNFIRLADRIPVLHKFAEAVQEIDPGLIYKFAKVPFGESQGQAGSVSDLFKTVLKDYRNTQEFLECYGLIRNKRENESFR